MPTKLRMQDKIIKLKSDLASSSKTIEDAFNSGIVDGYSKECLT